jgi:aminoglycoside phosphotransferase family enzyme/predicted kinase
VEDRLHTLITSLQSPARFDHPVERFEVIETHISIVLLTGPYAYKFKKPVNLGFLDFSTLEKRKFYCEEELRLNRRLAPELYLDVLPVTGTPEDPWFEGNGPAVEYCVRMRQFPQEAQLDRVLARGELTRQHIDDLALQVAAFHQKIARAAPETPFGTPAQIGKYALENFDQIQKMGTDHDFPATPSGNLPLTKEIVVCPHFLELRHWTTAQLTLLEPLLQKRKQDGWVRECHGDMHLTNMALLDGRIVLFDCIEFNPALYWIDVQSEVAFLLMDLDCRGRSDLAHRFLNRYLEGTGDYEGVALLDFYRTYRSMVRAKVACLQYQQVPPDAKEREDLLHRFQHHVELAWRYTEKHPAPTLTITHGLSGSGKTWFTERLVEREGAIRIRSDVERKRLAGFDAMAQSRSGLDEGLYHSDMTARTYDRLLVLARDILQSGFPVIVDATFLKRPQREAFRQLAQELTLPFRILDFQASKTTLQERIMRRQTLGLDASEATLTVLEHQLQTLESLAPEEMGAVVVIAG